MTYALPWHYSTTELKGLFIKKKFATLISHYRSTIDLLHNVHNICIHRDVEIIYVYIDIIEV